jgi:hypothetical protein
VVLALAMLGTASSTTLVLAWAYVALRVAHSLVQVLINRVLIRFALFASASLALIGLVISAAALLL